jgi:hypothetical protein
MVQGGNLKTLRDSFLFLPFRWSTNQNPQSVICYDLLTHVPNCIEIDIQFFFFRLLSSHCTGIHCPQNHFHRLEGIKVKARNFFLCKEDHTLF